MELLLIIPIDPQEKYDGPTEWFNGTQWRVSEPLDWSKPEDLKYHCISYVWGAGRCKEGLFQSKIPISDQTRSALEAAITTVDTATEKFGEPAVRAFWVDAVCVPQLCGPKRNATLESMGFIYGSATSTIVVLQQLTWELLKRHAYRDTAETLSFDEMRVLEEDMWIRSPWTYQEIVNSRETRFTCHSQEGKGLSLSCEQLFNCIGFSLEKWRKEERKGQGAVVKAFPNLNAMNDTAADWLMASYLERNAFCVLSNMALRRHEPAMEMNRILASLGALTKTASWITRHGTIPELVDMFMEICEAKNDYSFIYTSDIRNETPGRRWRPNPEQPLPNAIETARGGQAEIKDQRPSNLNVILAWHSWANPIGDTQRGRHDSAGFWLAKMVPLQSSTTISSRAHSRLIEWLRGPDQPVSDCAQGFAGRQLQLGEDGREGMKLEDALLLEISSIGFNGSPEPYVCTSGVFFPQESLIGRANVKMFAAGSIRWAFGAPGLARWTECDVGANANACIVKYTAGVFAGVVDEALAEELLML